MDDLLTYFSCLNQIDAAEQMDADLLEKDRASGEYIQRLLDHGSLDTALVIEFKVIINMIKTVNSMLSEGAKSDKFKANAQILERVERLAGQVIHYFVKIGGKLDRGVDEIFNVMSYLPYLGLEVSPSLQRTALRVWDEKIMSYVGA